MRKTLIALLCAAVMAVALPAMAFAAENGSPTGDDRIAPEDRVQPVMNSDMHQDGTTLWLKLNVETQGTDVYQILGFDADGEEYGLLEVAEGTKVDSIEIIDEKAGNFVEGNYSKVCTFRIKSDDFDANGDTITLAWEVIGNEYVGKKCLVFIEHGDGTFSQGEAGVVDGHVTIIMDKLSTITFALTDEMYEGKLGPVEIFYTEPAAKDTSSVSPKTGGIL